MQKKIRIIMSEPLLLLALPISSVSLLLIFILRPFIQVKIGFLRSDRLGHFAANTELLICEACANKHKRNIRSVSLYYLPRQPCNQQLACMWKRRLILLPWFLLRPIDLIIRSISCLSSFHAFESAGGDRDIDNLLDKIPAQLNFTDEEELRGKLELSDIGVKDSSPFICLTVRDPAYLNALYKGSDASYHNHRDSNIQSYVLAAEALADRGYYVIRMGAKVLEPLNSNHPRVIDYASNGKRSDFMDIYLGAKCFFAISTSTGWDAVPLIFRRPIAYVNMVPLGWLFTFSSKFLAITKHHVSMLDGQELSLREIFKRGVGFCSLNSDYSAKNIALIDNTPEEIRDLVIEMAERLEGSFQPRPEDEALQSKFWEIFPSDAVDVNGVRLHGEIRARYGAAFLRNNPEWLET